MFYNKEKINISILFHGVEYDNYKAEINKEMFIDIYEIKELVKFLVKKNFKFISCNEKINSPKTCSISFDDGYSGIKKFDDVSKEYSIPYTVFLNSYNILNNSPFIWDIYKYTFGKDFDFLSDYKKEYSKINPITFSEIKKNKIYMPLTFEDILKLDKNSLVKFSLHTHHHQVLMGNNFEKYNEEIIKNISFLKNFKNSDYKSIALPCGFYDQKLLKKLRDNFDKIFTINGGIAENKKIVNRISLLNTKNLSLLDQIEYFKSNLYIFRRYLVNKKYSLLSKIKNV
tara:strand:- start:416 stop:1270 length:855 start_codon:yes stop_codon:yes gene_type:complete